VEIWDDMRALLASLEAEDLLRRPPVLEAADGPRLRVAGREVVSFASNDYLGLAGDPAVRAAAIEAIRRWGVGAGGSRLMAGTTAEHVQLERRLAEFEQVEAVVVASTGWMANQLAVAALAGAGDLICGDKLNHASLIDAARASGAVLRTYRHADLQRLRDLLDRYRSRHRRCLIVTDGVFSMDGDLAPLEALVGLKGEYDAQLLVDEAHATGVLGPGGRGAAALAGVSEHIDATVGTLSKALGSLGGFVAVPAVLAETIRNTGRPYLFTTALPPAVCAAACEALRIVHDEPQRREKLLGLAHRLRRRLDAGGASVADWPTPIVPVIVGTAAKALEVSQALLAEGLLVPAIRPPTVPRGTSRLRISLSSAHEEADVDRLAAAILARLGGQQGG
jgi:8-amino-7-oxononanoate synthase